MAGRFAVVFTVVLGMFSSAYAADIVDKEKAPAVKSDQKKTVRSPKKEVKKDEGQVVPDKAEKPGEVPMSIYPSRPYSTKREHEAFGLSDPFRLNPLGPLKPFETPAYKSPDFDQGRHAKVLKEIEQQQASESYRAGHRSR
jgi:hypothetical protein